MANIIISNSGKSPLVRGNSGSNVILGWGVDQNQYSEAPFSFFNEVFYAGSGNDTIYAGAGKDYLYGEDGDDNLDGGTGDDYLYGGSGNDYLYGQSGNDRLWGGTGNDELFGGEGADFLSAGLGDDRLEGGDGNDLLNGEDGIDSMFGDAGNDYLSGGVGDDNLEGGAGADIIDGGSGVDWVSYIHSEEGVSVNLQSRINTDGDAHGDFLVNIENIVGSINDDSLTGNSSDNVLFGYGGADVLTGGRGADVFMCMQNFWGEGQRDFIGPEFPFEFSIQTVTDFQTNQDKIQMFWAGDEFNYIELDGSEIADIDEALNAALPYFLGMDQDFKLHVLFYNLNESNDGLLISNDGFLFHHFGPEPFAPVFVQLVGIDQDSEFTHSDIIGLNPA